MGPLSTLEKPGGREYGEKLWKGKKKKKNKTKSHKNLKQRASNLVILSVSVLCKMTLLYSPLKSFQ